MKKNEAVSVYDCISQVWFIIPQEYEAVVITLVATGLMVAWLYVMKLLICWTMLSREIKHAERACLLPKLGSASQKLYLHVRFGQGHSWHQKGWVRVDRRIDSIVTEELKKNKIEIERNAGY